jgi:hypothetical protein
MKTVREFNLAGPCIEIGRLVRETSKFYVYNDEFIPGHFFDQEKKIGKRRTHIEPCKRCTDHPQTDYPNGYTN